MPAVPRRILLGLTLLALASAAYALAASGKLVGRIGPRSRIQPNGRKLRPLGRLTRVGNHPEGAALTTNGRFYWTVSAGRGRNDVRIVQVGSKIRCKKPRRPRRVSRRASKRAKARYRRRVRRYKRKRRSYRRCVKRRNRQIARGIQ